MPLYDMDENQRSVEMPTEELQQFKAHLDHVRSNVVGQGIVSEIQLAPKLLIGNTTGSNNNTREDEINKGSSMLQFHVRDNTSLYSRHSPLCDNSNKNATNNNMTESQSARGEEEWPEPPTFNERELLTEGTRGPVSPLVGLSAVDLQRSREVANANSGASRSAFTGGMMSDLNSNNSGQTPAGLATSFSQFGIQVGYFSIGRNEH